MDQPEGLQYGAEEVAMELGHVLPFQLCSMPAGDMGDKEQALLLQGKG